MTLTGAFKSSLAQRNPILVLTLLGALFKFSANTPALAVLFQLPPRMKARRKNAANKKDFSHKMID